MLNLNVRLDNTQLISFTAQNLQKWGGVLRNSSNSTIVKQIIARLLY